MPNLEQIVLLKLFQEENNNSLDYINVDKLIQILNRHKLLPLGASILDYLKPEDRKITFDELKSWALKAMFLYNELINIINEFEANSIYAIPLKGPVLAYQLYGDISKRFYSDLDILIENTDLNRIERILSKHNYSLQYPYRDLSDRNTEKVLLMRDDIGFYNPKKNTYLEVHFGIYDSSFLKRDLGCILFENPLQIDLKGNKINTLNKEEYLIYLCYHAAKHSFYRLCWLRDIASVLKKWELDHNKVLSLTEKLELQRIVSISLFLVNKYFDIIIPDTYDHFLKNRPVLRWMGMLHFRIIQGPAKEKSKEVFRLQNILRFNRKKEDQVLINWFLIYIFGLFLKPGIKFKIQYILQLYKSMIFNRKMKHLASE